LHISSSVACYDCSRDTESAEDDFIIECEKPLELSVQSCLENVGISRLIEWDVLAFVYRHGTSLTSPDQIALLIGYEGAVVAGTLDRLEREKLIERSRASQGVHCYRIVASTNDARQRCLQRLISLVETRAGRRLLAKHLMSVSRVSLEKEGRWLCLKAI
jgi:DNA-binding MarR family transcriptional regulator